MDILPGVDIQEDNEKADEKLNENVDQENLDELDKENPDETLEGTAFEFEDIPKITNLDSVLTYHEDIPPGIKRHLADNLDHAFAPCRMFMLVLFRFPLLLNVRQDFSREFAYSWKSFRGWMFFITGALMTLNASLIMLALAGTLLDYPEQPKSYTTVWTIYDPTKSTVTQSIVKTQEQLRLEELFLLQRNFVPILMILLSLCHVCTGDVSLFFKRNFVAKYFTFWDEAVEIMKIDAAMHPDNVRTFMIKTTSFYCGFLIIFIGMSIGDFFPMASGAPCQLVILWCRIFYPQIHAYQYLFILRYFGYIFFAYIVMCSKAYILLFLYKCKILKNAFITWNERLEMVLHKGEQSRKRREQCETRTGFDHLFRDYVVLLDLLRGSDTMFTNVIESYYGTQVFSLCFEVYYFVRSFSAHEEFKQARKLDGILMGVHLFHTFIMLFLSSTAAAEVGEAAMDGLEIIRRKGCLGKKSNEEMYFTLSLYMSYTGHFETALTGGRYVTFDRSFIVALVGSIFAYFIILIQFTPPLAMLDKNKLSRIDPFTLIRNVEETRKFPGLDNQIGYDTLFSRVNFTS